jgi:alpha-1,2-mannosyltransferase
LGWFTLLIDRRPWLAGAVLGLVCYKPHFALLAPVGLLRGGHWRAILAAAAMTAGLAGLTAALFGVETWQAWLHAFAGSDAVFASGRIDYAGIVTPFGAARLLGAAPSSAYRIQGFVTALMALLIAWTWRPGSNQPARAATLLAATLLAVPLVLLYDKLVLLVAIAWLVRDGRAHGFLAWEKTVLLAVYVASIAEYAIGSAWHVPAGPWLSVAVLALALRRGGRRAAAAGFGPDGTALVRRDRFVAANLTGPI